MIDKKTRKICLAILALYIFSSAPNGLADESILDGVFLGDVANIAIGKFNLKDNFYLFSIPKDNPPTDRGVIWGEMYVFEYGGKKNSYVSIFDCGPVASHFQSVKIDFSDDDKYLVIESGGEGGAAIDVFDASELFVGPPGKGWNGTDKCVKPIATVGGYRVPVTFYGWDRHVPLVESLVPLNQVSTSREVYEYENQGKCCDGESRIFAWDISTNRFTAVKTP